MQRCQLPRSDLVLHLGQLVIDVRQDLPGVPDCLRRVRVIAVSAGSMTDWQMV
jgi:hypothetical protein